MDPSALIFVALAVAWAVYLIPKALQHHDEAVKSRSIDRFSQTMRVLARREPVNTRDARLVVTPAQGSAPVVQTKPNAPVRRTPAQRKAAARAAQRRRRVLGTLLLALAVVAGVAAYGAIEWFWTAVPGGLIVAWLVLCRVMVKSERAALVSGTVATEATEPAESTASTGSEHDQYDGYPEQFEVAANPQGFDEVAPSAETSVVLTDAVADPNLWDPLPMQLPTYVNKPAAKRSVRTIDLDSTGVWTSGRTEQDASLARKADAARAAERDGAAQERAVGS